MSAEVIDVTGLGLHQHLENANSSPKDGADLQATTQATLSHNRNI